MAEDGVEHYPHLREVVFVIRDKEGNLCGIQEEGYEKLASIFDKNKLCFSFVVQSDEKSSAKVLLENIIATNRRHRHIAVRKKETAKVE